MMITIDLYSFIYSLIFLVIIGVGAGFIANVIAGKGRSNLFFNFLLGIGGGLVGEVVLSAIGLHPWGLLGSFIAAVVGAVIILVMARMIKSSSSTKRW
jgi:uncharacterized membrane protein YeaQ/YmgE (transglycosylase-associated protein family)